MKNIDKYIDQKLSEKIHKRSRKRNIEAGKDWRNHELNRFLRRVFSVSSSFLP